ncbi:LemA family protein [Parasporobacterium paucivorans]|uniref:LemA protein n=1 Tax=Parasporobacterium paucivorans DSM 15970 TaxID=1122934 RepID=A0A1M6HCQ3_9FIRM|nr:LemA family protein [Parasporobacterium paucivorans]SHJ19869.1 LemA protein [Parasporobacterium paucivorans DSM 15970]
MGGYITVAAIVVVVLLYVLITYNGLVNLRNMVKEAFATMDVYLKKRWDLIPNIVETVKGYAQHEKETLEGIVNLRNSSYDKMAQNEKIAADNQITGGLSRLMALAESYPDLKANQNFLDLNTQLTKVEEDIANSRKYYNAVVRNYNNAVQMFPGNIISSIFGFKEMAMYETADRENIQVKF